MFSYTHLARSLHVGVKYSSENIFRRAKGTKSVWNAYDE